MNKAERVREARERASLAAAALAKYEADKAAAAKAADQARAKFKALAKRSPLVLAKVMDGYQTRPLSEVLGFGWGNALDAKGVKAALAEGTQKVTVAGGNQMSVHGAAGKLRYPSPLNIAAIKAARRKEERAQAAYNRANKARRDLELAAFEAGTKVTKEAVGEMLIALAKVRVPRDTFSSMDSWQRDRLVRDLEQANLHLTATRDGIECPCSKCEQDRMKARAEKAEAERRAALPLQSVTCPTHGRKRLHVGTVRQFFDEAEATRFGIRQGWHQEVPIAYCVGHGVLLVSAYKAALEKAAKAEARARKAEAKAIKKAQGTPPPEVGDEITFTCPSCGEITSEAEVYGAGDDGEDDDALVMCANCGNEMLAAGVARHAKAA